MIATNLIKRIGVISKLFKLFDIIFSIENSYFMTDTHPIRNVREAEDYIERVELFDESLSANLIWLEEQKKLGIFAPKFVFDHVIRQLYELINYKDDENPLMQIFIKKISSLGINDDQVNNLVSELSAVIKSDVKPGFSSSL